MSAAAAKSPAAPEPRRGTSTPLPTAIRQALAEEALIEDVAELSDDEDLFAAGLNSLSAVRLVLNLEELFDMMFPDEALTRDRLRSINAIAALVQSVQTEPTPYA